MTTPINFKVSSHLKIIFLVLLFIGELKVNAQTITTVAGNGTVGFGGDNGQATSANISIVNSIIFDPAGNMYFCDVLNNCVRKVTTSGIITTVAGNGSTTYAGDGVAATATGLNTPDGIVLDAAGNLYISDQYNYCVRKVNTAGIISTFAGTGNATYNGDGIAATAASLFNPAGLAIDGAGDIYIADAGHSRIRKVNSAGIISTVAGTGVQGYTGDNGLATAATLGCAYGIIFDAAGNFYLADNLNNCVRKVNTSGIITTIAGTGVAGYSGDGGPAISAQMDVVGGVILDGMNNLYIADHNNNRIRKVDLAGNITTLAGTGTAGYNGDNIPAITAELNKPVGVAIDASGNLYIGDYYTNRIRKIIMCQQNVITSTGSQSVTNGTTAQFMAVSSVTPATYQWQINQGVGFTNVLNGGQYAGATTSTLTISNITVANNGNKYRCVVAGCRYDTSSVSQLYVSVNTNINSLVNNQSFLIYPNPVKDYIYINSDFLISEIIIKDLTGRTVLKTMPNDKAIKINIENFAKGVYVLSGYSENRLLKQEKLVIKD